MTEQWRKRNRLKALNLAENNLHDSERSLFSLKRDMAKEIEMFQISIEKRQKKIHDCTRYDDVFWCSVLIFFFLLV